MIADHPTHTERVKRALQKRKGAASAKAETTPRSPQNGATLSKAPANRQGAATPSLSEASAALEETIRLACEAAGTDIEGFRKLPAKEQNAFLAQSRGEQRPEVQAAGKRLQMVWPAELKRSPWNREEFDEAKEKELLESVKMHGVTQPIQARPMSLYRQMVAYVRREWAKLKAGKECDLSWAEMATKGGVRISLDQYHLGMEQMLVEGRISGPDEYDEHAAYEPTADAWMPLQAKTFPGDQEWLEIVAGERRWRAATKANCQLPVVIAEMNDREALEKQAIENLNREDLNAMDEAVKFRQLLDEYEMQGATATAALEELTRKTAIERSTIYDRLKLLNLSEPLRKEVRSGRLPPSHAGLVAKISDPAVAEKLARQILKPESWQKNEDGILSYRQAKQQAEEVCKEQANLAAWQAQKTEYEKKGLKVLTPEESKKALSYTNTQYVEGDDSCRIDDRWRSWEKLWKKSLVPVPILARRDDGSPAVVYERAAAEEAVKASGIYKPRGSSGSNGADAAKQRAEEKRKLEKQRATLAVALGKVEGPHAVPSKAIWRWMGEMIAAQLHSDTARAIVLRRGLTGERTENYSLIKKHAVELENEKQFQAFVMEVMIGGGCYFRPEALQKLCDLFKVTESEINRAVEEARATPKKKVQTSGRAKK